MNLTFFKILVCFKTQLVIANEELANTKKLKPSLSYETSYNTIEQEIIKCVVNRNIKDFVKSIHKNRTQDIIKEILEILECKPTEKVYVENLKNNTCCKESTAYDGKIKLIY